MNGQTRLSLKKAAGSPGVKEVAVSGTRKRYQDDSN